MSPSAKKISLFCYLYENETIMEKEIVGMKLVGDYIACSNGRIFKLNWRRTGRTREVKQQKDRHGYLVFKFNGKNMFSHRFISMCFIPNLYNLPQVNHKNEVKTDNRVENLEWCTAEYNINYGTHNERVARSMVGKNVGKNINHHAFSKAVSQYTKDGEFIATYPSAHEAARQTGVWQQNISNCFNGKLKTAGGFVWRLAD